MPQRVMCVHKNAHMQNSPALVSPSKVHVSTVNDYTQFWEFTRATDFSLDLPG